MIGTKKPVGRPRNLKIVRLMKQHGCSRMTAYRKLNKQRLRIQSKHSNADRGLDPYFTCPEAIISLMALERAYLPRVLLDPCAGDGAFTRLMAWHGYETYANDIKDYGLAGCAIGDYLTVPPVPKVEGIVTNPPFSKALEFLRKAISEADYVAFLLRANFLVEAAGRDAFFEQQPPARTYYSSQRFPMMHRLGWTGKRSTSNTPFAWAVWDRRANRVEPPRRFRWRDILAEYESGRLKLGPLETGAHCQSPSYIAARAGNGVTLPTFVSLGGAQ